MVQDFQSRVADIPGALHCPHCRNLQALPRRDHDIAFGGGERRVHRLVAVTCTQCGARVQFVAEETMARRTPRTLHLRQA